MGFASRGFGEAYYFEYLEFAPASICWYDRAMKKHSRNSDGREDIQGFKYFKVLAGLTEHLREAYRDPASQQKRPSLRSIHRVDSRLLVRSSQRGVETNGAGGFRETLLKG